MPADEVAAFGTAFLPPDDAALKAIVDTALPTIDEGFAEPVQLAVDAISDALDGVELSRDDLHEQLRQRLPGELLPWCEGCQSHHARRGLLVMAALNGRLCISGRAGPPAGVLAHRPARRLGRAAARGGRRGARAALPRDLRPVVGGPLRRLGGAGQGARARAVGARTTSAAEPRRLDGVRLLAPGDPILLGRDRETLLPDAGARKKVWAALGGMGIVLADGDAGRALARPQEGQAARGRRRGARRTCRADDLDRGRAARAAPRLQSVVFV